ncbi:CCBE1 [Lepeophtheirus salmonis]|uniref:CCBE1 n=1 Tax=Lepeophtheirus salmonis TaxID=72036 RepID=A0A7R8CKU7_LEPSM|nr:CCBE1 [Lepeophtheirus salmonis]CAF2850658.1 CCBE1 [Lepeophtheirus salmonis]
MKTEQELPAANRVGSDGEVHVHSAKQKPSEADRDNYEVVEVKKNLDKVQWWKNNLMPLKVKDMPGLTVRVLVTERDGWRPFMWIHQWSKKPYCMDVEGCIRHLAKKGVATDDVKYFNQVTNLKRFIERSNNNE